MTVSDERNDESVNVIKPFDLKENSDDINSNNNEIFKSQNLSDTLKVVANDIPNKETDLFIFKHEKPLFFSDEVWNQYQSSFPWLYYYDGKLLCSFCEEGLKRNKGMISSDWARGNTVKVTSTKGFSASKIRFERHSMTQNHILAVNILGQASDIDYWSSLQKKYSWIEGDILNMRCSFCRLADAKFNDCSFVSTGSHITTVSSLERHDKCKNHIFAVKFKNVNKIEHLSSVNHTSCDSLPDIGRQPNKRQRKSDPIKYCDDSDFILPISFKSHHFNALKFRFPWLVYRNERFLGCKLCLDINSKIDFELDYSLALVFKNIQEHDRSDIHENSSQAQIESRTTRLQLGVSPKVDYKRLSIGMDDVTIKCTNKDIKNKAQQWSCPQCKSYFVHNVSLVEHISLCDYQSTDTFRQLSCPCDPLLYHFDSITKLDLHAAQKHSSLTLFRCGVCTNRYSRLLTLYDHVAVHHNIAWDPYETYTSTNSPSSTPECIFCSSNLTSKADLIDHYCQSQCKMYLQPAVVVKEIVTNAKSITNGLLQLNSVPQIKSERTFKNMFQKLNITQSSRKRTIKIKCKRIKVNQRGQILSKLSMKGQVGIKNRSKAQVTQELLHKKQKQIDKIKMSKRSCIDTLCISEGNNHQNTLKDNKENSESASLALNNRKKSKNFSGKPKLIAEWTNNSPFQICRSSERNKDNNKEISAKIPIKAATPLKINSKTTNFRAYKHKSKFKCITSVKKSVICMRQEINESTLKSVQRQSQKETKEVSNKSKSTPEFHNSKINSKIVSAKKSKVSQMGVKDIFKIKPRQLEKDERNAGGRFSSPKSVSSSMAEYNMVGKLLNNDEGKEIKNKASLNSRLRILPCNACKLQFHTLEARDKHATKDHIGVRMFKCQQCNTSVATHRGLRRHVLRHHPDYRLADFVKGKCQSKPEMFQCQYCQQKCKNKQGLNHHMNSRRCATNVKPDRQMSQTNGVAAEHFIETLKKADPCKSSQSCSLCNEVVDNAFELAIHSMNHELATVQSDDKANQFACPTCCRLFFGPDAKSYLKDHYNMVHLLKPSLCCEECDSRFSSTWCYTEHRRTMAPCAGKTLAQMLIKDPYESLNDPVRRAFMCSRCQCLVAGEGAQDRFERHQRSCCP